MPIEAKKQLLSHDDDFDDFFDIYGVPGTGKTLVGLDVAIKQTYKDGKQDDAS